MKLRFASEDRYGSKCEELNVSESGRCEDGKDAEEPTTFFIGAGEALSPARPSQLLQALKLGIEYGPRHAYPLIAIEGIELANVSIRLGAYNCQQIEKA